MNVEQSRILSQDEYSGVYTVLVLEAPAIASAVKPGQFVYMRIPRLGESVLRRPFSVFKADAGTLSILYKRVGKGTSVLNTVQPGEVVSLMGPLGKGYPLDGIDKFPVLVAGGYGVAPLCFLASRMPEKGLLFVGGSKAGDVLCVEEFEKIGWEVQVATEDGSTGCKGLVTDLLDAWLKSYKGEKEPELFACGPDGMLKAIGERAIKNELTAWLSLEKHMGCAVGACLACVHKIKLDDNTEAWGRVCKDGPVFESRKIQECM